MTHRPVPAAAEEMMASQESKGYVTVDSSYGLCVNRVTSLPEGRMIDGHRGMSAGVLCSLYWGPETDFVFTMMSNGCNNGLDNCSAKLARRAFSEAWNAFSGE